MEEYIIETFKNHVGETMYKLIEVNDILVIRGKGKFCVYSIEGETRKGKIAVIVEHYL